MLTKAPQTRVILTYYAFRSKIVFLSIRSMEIARVRSTGQFRLGRLYRLGRISIMLFTIMQRSTATYRDGIHRPRLRCYICFDQLLRSINRLEVGIHRKSRRCKRCFMKLLRLIKIFLRGLEPRRLQSKAVCSTARLRINSSFCVLMLITVRQIRVILTYYAFRSKIVFLSIQSMEIARIRRTGRFRLGLLFRLGRISIMLLRVMRVSTATYRDGIHRQRLRCDICFNQLLPLINRLGVGTYRK